VCVCVRAGGLVTVGMRLVLRGWPMQLYDLEFSTLVHMNV